MRWHVLSGLESLDEESVALPQLLDSKTLRIPYAAEAIELVMRGSEVRRRWMMARSVAEPEQLDVDNADLAAAHKALLSRARRAIKPWAVANASDLGLLNRPVEVISVRGCLRADSTGSVRGRVAVQLLQRARKGAKPRGTTLWCDSSGKVLHVIKGTPTSLPLIPTRLAQQPWPTTHADLGRSLAST